MNLKISPEIEALIDADDTETLDVCYVTRHGGFDLYTVSNRAVKLLTKEKIRFTFDPNLQVFRARADRLPKLSSVSFYQFEINLPLSADKKKINASYKKILKMRKVQEELERQIMALEDDIQASVVETGIRLKPGARNDAMVYLPEFKTRLHHQIAMHKEFADLDTIKAEAMRYPELKRCIKKRTMEFVDEELLLLLISKLPARTAQKLFYLAPSYRFVETKLKGSGCVECGKKILKTYNRCSACGTPVAEENVVPMKQKTT